MIDPTNAAALRQASPTMPVGGTSAKGPFDDALAAAQRAEASQAARDSDMASIRSKGFSNWARDTRIEKLKEELRRKVMSEMGLTEGDLGKVSDAIRQVLEQKIKEEVEKRMMALRDQQDQGAAKDGDGKTAPARPAAPSLIAAQESPQAEDQQAALPAAQSDSCEPGKKDRLGKSCPVIPALATPGGESFF
ncbi:MAG: hypothetical protein HY055_15445 [Magnetospirillum sp.]|nr:hypothetical protein [Magnetospirillum sp.]